MADEKLISLMVRLASRLDKVEADLIELKGFVGFIKAKQKQEETKKSDDEMIEDIKFETFKQRLGDM
jgi:hypothetical protein